MFFWLQEPDNSNDDLIITRFGDCINKTSVSGQWQDREAVPASAQTSDQVVADAFAKFFAAAAEQQNGVNLEDVLTPDVVERVAAQPGISNRLVEFLPEGMQNQVRRSTQPCPSWNFTHNLFRSSQHCRKN